MRGILGLSALLTASYLSACTPCEEGDGIPFDRVVSSTAIERIVLDGAYEVDLTQGDEDELTLTTDENIADRYLTVLQGSTLTFRTEGDTCVNADVTPRITGTFTTLSRIDVNGSGDVRCEDMDVESFTLTIDGSGDADLRGSAEFLRVEIEGSGDVEAEELEAEDCEIRIDGSGDADVNCTETLDIDINGSGDVRYAGSPSISQDIDGSGDVSPL